MNRLFISFFILGIGFSSGVLYAAEEIDMEGISILGNQELPKTLFIVPWKDAESAMVPDRPLNSLLNDALQPVDPDVFRRRLQYFDAVHKTD
jgi:hypothetical protein